MYVLTRMSGAFLLLPFSLGTDVRISGLADTVGAKENVRASLGCKRERAEIIDAARDDRPGHKGRQKNGPAYYRVGRSARLALEAM